MFPDERIVQFEDNYAISGTTKEYSMEALRLITSPNKTTATRLPSRSLISTPSSSKSASSSMAGWTTRYARCSISASLPSQRTSCSSGASFVEEGRKTGHTRSQPDLIIAATALHHGLTVATRDTADYSRARVAVFNPWTDPTS